MTKPSKLIPLMKVGDLFGRGGRYKYDEGWTGIPLRFYEVKKCFSVGEEEGREEEELWEFVYEPGSIRGQGLDAKNIVRLPLDDVLVLVAKGVKFDCVAGDFEEEPIGDIFWSISREKLIGIRRSSVAPLEKLIETIEKFEGRKKDKEEGE